MSKLFLIFSRISFSIVLASLFLPFVVVKCVDKEIATASGIALITGNYKMEDHSSKFDPSNPFKKQTNVKENPENEKLKEVYSPSYNPYMIIVALIGILGLIITFIKLPFRKEIILIMALAGFLLLIIMANMIDASFSKLSGENAGILNSIMPEIIMQYGFYICATSFLLVFLEPLITLFKNEEQV
jgi:hypothetical protein